MNVDIKVKKPFLMFWLNKKSKVIPDNVARGLNSWASSSVGRPLFR